ncbi:MAG: sigma-54-dependent Fis family transcriptional regulator, partial [candidate division Zixibacteria bacterium]|nr:sigma-54-dependent Fis family transcriptional regulator [candidate division Zixibacteria bacterium]
MLTQRDVVGYACPTKYRWIWRRTMITIDKNEFFRQATIRICGTLDIEAALRNTLDLISDYMPVTIMYLHLFEPSLCAIKSVGHATISNTEEIISLIPIPEDVVEQFITSWTELKDVIIINRPEDEPVTHRLTDFIPINDRSLMILPLMIDGQRFGAFTINAVGWDQYEQHHADLIAILNEPFAIAMSNVLKHREVLKYKEMLEDDNQYLHHELFRISGDEIIGAESGLKNVMEMVRQVSHLNSPVLLLGETGVGKEVIANAIHFASSRKDGPFIKVNCGAIPDNL